MKLFVEHVGVVSARIYRLYLSVIPAFGTLGILVTARDHLNILAFPWFAFSIFCAGVVAIAIYLGSTLAYTAISNNVFKNSGLLLDTPFISILFFDQTFFGACAMIWLIECASSLLGLMGTVIHSQAPTKDQRRASLAVVLIPSVLTILTVYWYLSIQQTTEFGWLGYIFSVAQGSLLQYNLTMKDQSVGTRGDESASYLLVGVVVWVICFFVGTAIAI